MKKVLSIVLCTVMLLSLFVVSASAAAWDGTTASTSLKGEGTADKPYLVETAEDLAFLAKDVNGGNNYEGKYITQTADIDLGNKEWTPIGTSGTPFCGVYNALGNKITGFSITKETRFLGLFGYIKGTTAEAGVANLTLEGKLTFTTDFATAKDAGVGALVGWAYQDSNDLAHRVKIINVVNNVDVSFKGLANQLRIGVVAGYAYCTDFENVVNNGDITVETTAAARVGGITGQGNRSTYTNCVNNGDVTVVATNSQWAAGAGITAITTVKNNSGTPVGVASTYTNCVNNGNVSVSAGGAIAYAAGFVANPYHGGTNKTNYIKIDGCVNTGDITGTRTDAADYAYVGGLLAYNNKEDVAITNSVNSGKVTAAAGASSKGGGIAGVMNNAATNCFIKDCVASANVVGWSAQKTDTENSTANADTAAVNAAIKAIEDKLAPSATKIAGFDTAYKAPVVPDPTPTPTPNPGTGDVATLLVVMAIISLAGVVVTKKVSAR